MTQWLEENFQSCLIRYSPELVDAVSNRAARFLRNASKKEPVDRLVSALTGKKSSARLIAELPDTCKQTLALFMHSPRMAWRWDHAVRLVAAVGAGSPYQSLQQLLDEGLLVMQGSGETPLDRFTVSGATDAAVMPSVSLSAPLEGRTIDFMAEPLVALDGAPMLRVREADGWELVIRLAGLWRLAWRGPFRRTQQNQLFKRDLERITENPLATAAMLDAPIGMPDVGQSIHELAERLNWFLPGREEQIPRATIDVLFPADFNELLLGVAAGAIMLETWNELGDQTPIGMFARESPSARYYLLLCLSALKPGEGTTIAALAQRLLDAHPPWNATGELVGPLRDAANREAMAERWATACLFGPLYQCKLVCIGDGPGDETLVALTEIGRKFLGLESADLVAASYPQTLLAQPNHEVVVYRQGLSVELLTALAKFCEIKSLGAAIVLEITAVSVYTGLEAGQSPDAMIELLERFGGRPIPGGLAESIRTFARKREQVTVHSRASLFEFASAADLEAAVKRGLDGIRLSDTLLIANRESDGKLNQLRITASRDYRLPSERCVETGPDGITLSVDLSRSDLLLEAEITRFADLADNDIEGRRRYRVSIPSLARGFEQGLTPSLLGEWFFHRTGSGPSPAIQLMIQSTHGLPLQLRDVVVLQTTSPFAADGLLQHPATKSFFSERLGAMALVVDPARMTELRDALASIGMALNGSPKSE